MGAAAVGALILVAAQQRRAANLDGVEDLPVLRREPMRHPRSVEYMRARKSKFHQLSATEEPVASSSTATGNLAQAPADCTRFPAGVAIRDGWTGQALAAARLDVPGAHAYDFAHELPACPRAAYCSMFAGISLSCAGTADL
jgi:hypothetical protein